MSTTYTGPTRTLGELSKTIFSKGRSISTEILEFMHRTSSAYQCSQEVERLMSLSDVELAKIDVKRRDIVSYAFRRYMHI